MDFQFFFSNSKTGVSYDFGICPLMSLIDGQYRANCGVAKCYATQSLNYRRTFRKKLERMSNVSPELMMQELDYMLDVLRVPLIRAFSFGDYQPSKRNLFLNLVDKIHSTSTRHLVLSKTLWLLDPSIVNYVSDHSTLSLGFTTQLLGKFTKFIENNYSIQTFNSRSWSIAFTYEKEEELESIRDHWIFPHIKVFHCTYIHNRTGFKNHVEKRKVMDSNIKKYLDAKPDIQDKFCNAYGYKGTLKMRGCLECIGCEK